MKYYMLESYKSIPQYAEVKMIGHCFDSGYSCYEVKYNGVTYKPFERDVISYDKIKERFDKSCIEYNVNRKLYNKTVGIDYIKNS